ncbi:hypothetical protein IU459_31860 [Nocardia amamiensis]|uniref:AMP-binding enzyme C-terminal domain-containing protein n=1 Tax=Nocardia amamiensis TaxID=404578 RepID=A0ABS0CZT5_9NOCA|nr:hypothetical protein [Nocardia amamiensis]MBF6302104.1 hypothetical protein [Nocardia amamiensis]
MVVDGPPHPNPNRASEGLKLRILSLDASTAPVVQRADRHDRQDLTGDELRAFAGQRLARYKIPRTFTYTEHALRDDAGKVRRQALLDRPSRPDR